MHQTKAFKAVISLQRYNLPLPRINFRMIIGRISTRRSDIYLNNYISEILVLKCAYFMMKVKDKIIWL